MYLASKVVSVANGEVNYQEKASNANLDDKHANAGSNNYTKYHRDMGHSAGPDYPWCQTFVDWCFVTAYGKEGAKQLLCGYLGASTMESKNAFVSSGRIVQVPQPGDIWWRSRGSGKGHVGIIVSASTSGNGIVIRTVEGNTSPGSSGSQWNGDGVYCKSHTISGGKDENGNQSWFGHPAYDGQGDAIEYTGGAVTEDSSTGFSINNLLENASSGFSSFTGMASDALSGIASNVSSFVSDLASAFASRLSGQYINATFELSYQTVVTEIERDEIRSVDDYNIQKLGTNLLSYPSIVEAPYVILTVGDYKFGTYSKDSLNDALHVNYPNYIQSMEVSKISGQVNQYTINIVYQIQYGDDPNLLDRIFSTVGYGTVKISYGDWSSPTFIYREEEAIITNLSSSVDFGSSKISYTLKCTSNALVLASGYFDFPRRNDKPSNVIKEILFNSQYGLQEVFTGMTNKTRVNQLNLIASDDKTVEIEAKHGIDALSYINYLVTCMNSNTNNNDDPIKDSTYFMTIYDDTYGDAGLNGSYFKITKVNSTTGTLSTPDVYVVDVGFPTNNLVTSFRVLSTNSWSLLYNYSERVNTSEYAYSIDNKGQMLTQYSPAVAMSSKNLKMTESQKTWWTNMTQFPIKAELGIKGLVRSTLLMTYLRVNALFYGQRHVSSGLYTITKQVDRIDSTGYRTTLSLLRIAGDNDYIVRTKKQVTSNLPVAVITKPVEISTNEDDNPISAFANRAMNTISNLWDTISNPSELIGNLAGNYGGGAFSDNDFVSGILTGGSSGGGASHSFDTSQVESTTYNGNVDSEFLGRTYQCTDAQILGICAGCIAEQGSFTPGVAWEASLLVNLLDNSKKYSDPYTYMVSSGWFAKRTVKFIKNSAYIGADIDGYKLTEEHFKIVKDIIVYGNRWTKANEHDTVNDISKLIVNGTTITDKATIKNKNNSAVWIPGVTQIYNTMGSRYTFVGFPGGNTKCDPFGVKF